MYQYKGLEDTITAIATPAGTGGIGIVRVSGQDAIEKADNVLRLHGSKTLSQAQSHSVHHGWVVRGQEMIDEVLVSIMRSPKSYTGENVVEISCHGGATVLKEVLNTVLSSGARLATPGEFTKRAFINGRMDLAQAEAVIDIINAKTSNFLRQSQHQLKGELSQELNAIRDELLKIYTMVEAMINFPEDDINPDDLKKITARIHLEEQKISKLLKSAENGRILKEGIRIVIAGLPNVGKSSLLNALLKEQRAIVTNIAGTTRDVLEESAQIQGIPISLVDTAGILEPRDLIEEEAIKRSHLYIKGADLVLLVLDHSRALQEADFKLMEQLKTPKVLVVINKKDLKQEMDLGVPEKLFGQEHLIKVSSFDAASIAELEKKIVATISQDKHLDAHGIMISNIRHVKALEVAEGHLKDAVALMNKNTSLEFISEDIKSAVNQLDAITGRNIDEDLLDRIFSEFCIGK